MVRQLLRARSCRVAHVRRSLHLAPASPGHCAGVLDRQDVQGRSEAASRVATNTGKPRIMHPCVVSGDFGSWKMLESRYLTAGRVARSPESGRQVAKAAGADELAGAFLGFRSVLLLIPPFVDLRKLTCGKRENEERKKGI